MVLVGSYVGLSKWLVVVFPVFLLAWLRFGIAAVAMLPWLRRSGNEAPLSAADRKLLFWESFLGNFLFSICMLLGVAHTSATAAGVVMAGLPAAVALLSRWWLKEPISRPVAAGIGLAVAGVLLLTLSRQAPDTHLADAPWWGYALLIAAVFCEASYVVIGKQLTGQVSPKRISALINLWGLVLITPLGLWQAVQFDFSVVALKHWAALLAYALAASMITVWLWMRGLREVPAPRAGVLSVFLPLSATAVGVLFLGEHFGAAHAMALLLALAGLLLATWPSVSPTSRSEKAE
ncbi:DMT family transporter [Ideonella sp.]|uniref:DMT family transporter n=1 Tax=Ideonella sp. TaxID=1929293 RepID=UPI003BB5654B